MLPEERRKQLDQIVGQMDKNGESSQNIQAVISDFKKKYSGNTGQIVNTNQTSNPVANFLLGKALNLAKDYGAGITANITNKARQGAETQGFNQGKQLEDMAARETDPQKKVALLKQAQQLYRGVGQGATEVASSFSPDIQENPLSRSVKAGAEIAATAEIPELVYNTGKAIISKGGNLLNKIIRPRATAIGERDVIANQLTQKGVEVPITNLSQRTAKQLLEKTAKSGFLKNEEVDILNKIATGGKLSPEELVRSSELIRNIAKTASNSDRWSAVGRMAGEIYDDLVKTQSAFTPEIYKQTVNIAKTFPKAAKELEPLQRFLTQKGIPITAGAGGLYILNKILGNNQSNNYYTQ